MIRTFVLIAAVLTGSAFLTPSAQAGTHVSVGVGIGGGYGYGGYGRGPYCGPYGRPYYGGGYYGGGYYGGYNPYYRPYYAPVYYAPPPTVYVQEPVYAAPSYVATTWQVTQVQTQLGRLRFYQGSADGVVGPNTRNAVAAFQQDRGLAVTGNINPQVLSALEIPQ